MSARSINQIFSAKSLSQVRRVFEEVERYCLDMAMQSHDTAWALATPLSVILYRVSFQEIISFCVGVFLSCPRLSTTWILTLTIYRMADENIIMEILLHLDAVHAAKRKKYFEDSSKFKDFEHIAPFCHWLVERGLGQEAKNVLESESKSNQFWQNGPENDDPTLDLLKVCEIFGLFLLIFLTNFSGFF